MNIKLIIYTIIVLFIGLEIGYHFFYSPKATVRRLLRQMYKLPIKFKKAAKKANNKDDYYYDACKNSMEKLYSTVNTLLGMDYNFDPHKDESYIKGKKELAQSLLYNLNNIFKRVRKYE